MPLQDLTPQLRTRLRSVEMAVGLFLLIALAILAGGLFLYLKHTAEREGWFKNKARYFAFVESAEGIEEGDGVQLMGFNVGELVKIEAMPADNPVYNVYLEFEIREPYYGYIWSDSKIRVLSGDLFGNRVLELTKGVEGLPTYKEEDGELSSVYDSGQYIDLDENSRPFWMQVEESPSITQNLNSLVANIERSLPGVFDLTNTLTQSLETTSKAVATADLTMQNLQPAITNLTLITQNLCDPEGSLGRWLLPQDLRTSALTTMSTTSETLTNLNEEIVITLSNLNHSLVNAAMITSNLNSQFESNSDLLFNVSVALEEAGQVLQGLRKHWFLRSAFKKK